jgi:uncharacterized damage-inducible protein DinB
MSMYRKIEDFQKAYGTLREGTGKILASLSDQNLDQAVGEGHRNLGDLAWHIVTTIPEMMAQTGLGLSAVDPRSLPPHSAEKIRAAYEAASRELAEAVAANWQDATLAQEDDLYGQKWSRGMSLAILIHHEIHHRGQMTVLLRQAGAKVPGIYGPAKEEWTAYGQSPPPY